MNTEKAIIVWAWEDAPEEYKKYFENGGDAAFMTHTDENFVAFIPQAYIDSGRGRPLWLDRLHIWSAEYKVEGGGRVMIAATHF